MHGEYMPGESQWSVRISNATCCVSWNGFSGVFSGCTALTPDDIDRHAPLFFNCTCPIERSCPEMTGNEAGRAAGHPYPRAISNGSSHGRNLDHFRNEASRRRLVCRQISPSTFEPWPKRISTSCHEKTLPQVIFAGGTCDRGKYCARCTFVKGVCSGRGGVESQ